MSAEALVVPVNPFRPGIENMGFVYTGSRSGTTNRIRSGSSRTSASSGTRAPPESAPGIPTLTFRGYFQRPDGTIAALFYDSIENASRFFTPGSSIREATLLSADARVAKVQLPDGQAVDLAMGGSFTLPAAKP